jgi:replicative DNA helicase
MNTDPHIPASTFRTPPHNIEAEQALLGAVLVHPRAWERVSEAVRPEHFALAQHARIFEACARLIDAGRVADPIALKGLFERDGTFGEIGGAAYLADLVNAAVGPVNAGEYARLIADLARKRRLIEIGEALAAAAFEDTDREAGDILADLEAALTALATEETDQEGPVPLSVLVAPALRDIEAAYQRKGALAGMGTGLKVLDDALGGMGRGDLIVLAGATSSGKTALALNIAEFAARRHLDSQGREGAPVAVFSLEMPARQLIARLLSRRTGIEMPRLRRGALEEPEWNPLNDGAGDLTALPLFVDDTGGLTLGALRSRCRKVKRQHGLGLVVIDYLQLLTPDNRYAGNRASEIGQITRGLKALALELDVPVIALSQLSREVDKRDNKRPRLSDLRESGTLEQDADTVLFVYRAEYYLTREEPTQGAEEPDDKFARRWAQWETNRERAQGKAEIIVAKNRNGQSGQVLNVGFDGKRTLFHDADLPEGH